MMLESYLRWQTALSPAERAEFDAAHEDQYRMTRATPAATVPCGECAICCRGDHTTVWLLPEERDRFETIEVAGMPVLRRQDNGDCWYWRGECTTYATRPAVCRTFDCRYALAVPEAVAARGRSLR